MKRPVRIVQEEDYFRPEWKFPVIPWWIPFYNAYGVAMTFNTLRGARKWLKDKPRQVIHSA